MNYDRLASAALVIGLAGCGVAYVRHTPPAPAPAPAVVTTTVPATEIGQPLVLTDAYCRAYAPHINEDEVPYDHDGAPLVSYDSMDGIGCGVYADGWVYDGLGWVAP